MPSANGLYPAQWLWDSAFVSLAFGYLGDHRRGWKEIEMLCAAQWSDGMIPHIVFHADDSSYFPNSKVWRAGEALPSSGITQPPVIAIFLQRLIAHRNYDTWSKAKLRTLFPHLLRYHRWYHTVRNYNGLVKIIHPWESGFDNNQSYEEALHSVPLDDLEPYSRKDTDHAAQAERPHNADYDHYIALVQFFRKHDYDNRYIAAHSPFQFIDIGVNSMLLRADYELHTLATWLGEDDAVEEIATWIEALSAALAALWDEELGLYVPLNVHTNTRVNMPSINGFLPLFAVPKIAVQRLDRMCTVIERWLALTTFGMPSFDPEHPLFEPRRYCRGSVWPVWSWLVKEGLQRHNRTALATRITRRLLHLIAEHGFYEYYDPFDGQGCGGTDFSWTAALSLFFLRDTAAFSEEDE